ncbi:hypothetical protein QBC41DRAFT_44080 [Cercophora samala]|uniref:Uncharacterized protein n=1 Tax=Cercophora samala TaxID=330535 RepID=A0AA39YXZ7_9PEZI|nr:hypothetical protein QBC41DRAFT_44080 [Cercophora samala]
MAKKTYILAPNFTTSPSSLHLGDILPDPLSPDLIPLNRKSRLPIEPADLLPPTTITSFSSSRKDLLTGRFGLWTTLLAGLGLPVGGDLGLFLERGSNDEIQVPELETREFVATEEYINKVLKQDSVRGYLDERKYRAPVYIVTGVKIARGALVSLEKTKEVDARVGLSGPEGIAEVKPMLQFARNRVEAVSFDTESEFVMAFRVRRIKFAASGKVDHELYLRGTSMMGEEKDVQETKVESVDDDFVAEEDEVEVFEDSEGIQWAVSVDV